MLLDSPDRVHFQPRPVTLAGGTVYLEPLGRQHVPGLKRYCSDPGLWYFLPSPAPRTTADFEALVAAAQSASVDGSEVAFAIVLQATGEAVGSTRFLDIRHEHHSLEIGWTFVAPAYQQTVVHTEAKYLLLRHVFEDLEAVRVTFKTDARNTRAQRALSRIGARREGVLRRDHRLWTGHYCDTVCYSILDEEWLEVKERLQDRLA